MLSAYVENYVFSKNSNTATHLWVVCVN